ncbi:MAG: hypothetical protein IJX23_00990, partial [Clostridia bacterium]|nr:hypothetical protein [Clostridia bacterium]
MEEQVKTVSQNPQNPQKKVQTSEDIIANANKFYKIWLKLPLILFIAITVISFIWGIVDPCIFAGGGYYDDEWYGILHAGSGFGAWFAWQLIGWAVGGIVYALAKICMSVPTLQ